MRNKKNDPGIYIIKLTKPAFNVFSDYRSYAEQNGDPWLWQEFQILRGTGDRSLDKRAYHSLYQEMRLAKAGRGVDQAT